MPEKLTREQVLSMSGPELAAAIDYHNQRYWDEGEPEISDELYDLLTRRLTEINPDHPILEKVNAPKVAGEGKVKHEKPMLSLDKAYTYEELRKWAEKYARNDNEEFLIEPKYDGISAIYTNGTLATRGDGYLGENITQKIPLIELEKKDFTGKLANFKGDCRGEIVIRDDDFRTIYANIKKKDGKPYKNSRNAVAGIMGLKEIDNMIEQGAKLTLANYDLKSYRVKLKDLDGEWPEMVREIEEMPYPMDGIVVKLADEEYAESLGSTAHHPRGQIAFKFSGVREKTKLLDVKWSFGKNCLTPVAELAPVEIGGITIRHATLHNAQNIIDKDIKIGDMVTVERAGDVIPYIIEAEPGENRVDPMIDACPGCGGEVKRKGPELMCINPDCFETKVQRLTAAVKNIGIENLGEPNIRRMMNTLGIKSLHDIFNLGFDDIMKLEGFKEKSTNNLLREIASARKVPDYQLLAALNIYGIGQTVARSILTEYTLEELRQLDLGQLSEISGIGPERAAALKNELAEQSEVIDELLDTVEVVQTKGGGVSEAPTICFTGKMPEKRSYYEDLAKERGFQPTDHVTADLGILVADDPSGNSSKLKKARKGGVKIISLDDWLNEKPGPAPTPETSPPEGTSDDLFGGNNGQMTFNF